jgi:hypothetical protein
MRRLILATALAAGPLAAPAAAANTSETITCPIGGESFAFGRGDSDVRIGTRPDGKPYGTATYPPPLPECPANGLVLYKQYTPEEVAKLEPIVASEAYQSLRTSDTSYYRAYRLMKEMGLGPEDYLWVLLQASWQADGEPKLKTRYLTELVEGSAAATPRPDDLNWIGMEARSANALRELGRFDEAVARLDKIPTEALDVRVPLGQATDPAVREAKSRRAWLDYMKELRTAIARKDQSSEPLDLIPRAVAHDRCLKAGSGLSASDSAFCQRESAAVEALRTRRDQAAREAEALRQSREASGR